MANISFLDLMFAEALASGLAREGRRAERPPPDNFFLMPGDGDGWRKIRDASKRENMVVCIEFTDNSNDNCLQVQRVFMDLAREFEGIPFIRAVIGLGSTFDSVCTCACTCACTCVCTYMCVCDAIHVIIRCGLTWVVCSTHPPS